jgi:hypothetical protein|uniref:Uncharacterized protein n=1 Tax=Fadolivirus 2 TaxID=2740747 RepID=A0A7D3QVF2_9VIRU|nr:hypothetical protein Fadolivirus_2_1 [Fadolivirus 2]
MSLKQEILLYKETIQEIIKENLDKLKYYTLMTDISQLKTEYFIKYIKKDEMNRVYYGGKVDSIEKKDNGDHLIIFKTNNNFKWNLLLSKVFIFYRTKPMTEIRKEEYKKWKENMQKNDPEKYEEWKKAKKQKEDIRKLDPKLYKELYVHIKTSKKKT